MLELDLMKIFKLLLLEQKIQNSFLKLLTHYILGISRFAKLIRQKVRGLFRALSNIQDGAFCEIVNRKTLTIFTRNTILEVWQGSEYTS